MRDFCQLSEHRDATHPLVKKPPCVPVYVPVFCPGKGVQPATRMPAAETAAISQRQERAGTRETFRP